MHTRTRIAATAALGLVGTAGPGLLLASSAFAAPTPTPSDPPRPTAVPTTPSVVASPVPSGSLPSVAPRPGSPTSISVPAGKASRGDGGNAALVIGLTGGGVLLVVGGVITLAARRR